MLKYCLLNFTCWLFLLSLSLILTLYHNHNHHHRRRRRHRHQIIIIIIMCFVLLYFLYLCWLNWITNILCNTLNNKMYLLFLRFSWRCGWGLRSCRIQHSLIFQKNKALNMSLCFIQRYSLWVKGNTVCFHKKVQSVNCV